MKLLNKFYKKNQPMLDAFMSMARIFTLGWGGALRNNSLINFGIFGGLGLFILFAFVLKVEVKHDIKLY